MSEPDDGAGWDWDWFLMFLLLAAVYVSHLLKGGL